MLKQSKLDDELVWLYQADISVEWKKNWTIVEPTSEMKIFAYSCILKLFIRNE